MVSQDPQGIQLKGSVKGRHTYLFCCDFSSCSESEELWHADSFLCQKMSLGFFFHKWGNEASNSLLKVQPPSALSPPPPPPNGVKHTHTVF